MLNRQKLRETLRTNSAYQGAQRQSGGARWNYAKTPEIQDGQIGLRFFWPHAQKCPDGFDIGSSFEIETVQGQPGTRVLSPVGCTGNMIPSYFAERLAFQMMKYKLLQDCSPGLIDAIEKLSYLTSIMFPVAFFCEARVVGKKPGTGKNKDKQYDVFEYHPGNAGPHPRIWQMDQRAEYFAKLEALMEKYPDFNDPMTGRTIIMQRSGNAIMFVASDTPSPAPPDMIPMHNNMMDLMKTKRSQYREPEGIEHMIKNSWWFQRLLGSYQNMMDFRTDNELRIAGQAHLIQPNWTELAPPGEAATVPEVSTPYGNQQQQATPPANDVPQVSSMGSGFSFTAPQNPNASAPAPQTQQAGGFPDLANMDLGGLFNSLGPNAG